MCYCMCVCVCLWGGGGAEGQRASVSGTLINLTKPAMKVAQSASKFVRLF